jgi:hypothetical protein
MLFRPRARTTATDSRGLRRRSGRRPWYNAFFRSVSSDEDGGSAARLAASGASNQHGARGARRLNTAAASDSMQFIGSYFGCG